MKKLFLLLAACCGLSVVKAQAPVEWNSAEMFQAIRKLNVLGSVLYVAAHPDDENTRLIAYLSKDRLYRTGYLSMTRGDGGQNLIGDEQGIELGLIRTQELLAARRVDGGEQFFTRAFDFGYSKNPEETFRIWDKEKILSDVVWMIRKFQPDVIITRFPTTGEGGHGHHTASAILANEAFTAAADPNRFPEQLKYGVKPWQAKRILWNTFNFGSTNTTNSDQFHFDVGGYNPLLGKSYGEIAAISRSNHKTQGFGSAGSRGEAMEYFRTTGGTRPEKDIMDGVDLTWHRVNGGEAIEKMVNKLITSFDFLHPEKTVRGLVDLSEALKKIPDGYWKTQKLKDVLQLIQQCSGLFMDATTSRQYAVQTDSVRISFSLNDRLGDDVVLKNIRLDDRDSALNLSLQKDRNVSFTRSYSVSKDKPVTQPYWLVNKMAPGHYNVSDQSKIGQANADPAYSVEFTLNFYGKDFVFTKPVKYRFTDPVKGELYEPLVVVPPVLISPEERIKLSIDSNDFAGILDVRGEKKGFMGDLKGVGVAVPDEVGVHYDPGRITVTDPNKIVPVNFSIKANRDNEYSFSVDEENGTKDAYHLGMKEIRYDHIPYITYFTDATVINRKLDLKIAGKKIGYIVGAGDKVPEALQQMGYEVVLLGDKELSRNDLQQYDAIITGVRAYNTNDWMNNHYDQLMKYISDGGNLIVQYNTNNNIGPVRAKIGPYNFDISRNRVTDENAVMNFLHPDQQVLNFPNRITQKDFEGWIQERSIYHAANFDRSKFETVFSMHDPGEQNDDGSLIIARYGKGVFVYTGLVFFRELPAGVPGAYRLMANIIALNTKKEF
ncbi:MAG: PIG-L family deacetylase [Sphingobacteriales bacterium UTBCD1]|jgi:LmbE family N-acetylglucosaminyl deacetylase|nr:MAG: PIG-L family deacetylase [Sphingobacteriales bacterium UTBCD1]